MFCCVGFPNIIVVFYNNDGKQDCNTGKLWTSLHLVTTNFNVFVWNWKKWDNAVPTKKNNAGFNSIGINLKNDIIIKNVKFLMGHGNDFGQTISPDFNAYNTIERHFNTLRALMNKFSIQFFFDTSINRNIIKFVS